MSVFFLDQMCVSLHNGCIGILHLFSYMQTRVKADYSMRGKEHDFVSLGNCYQLF